ncbi:MAG: cytochrome c biogenesis protein CcsA, partial [Bacteroidota bacterium]
ITSYNSAYEKPEDVRVFLKYGSGQTLELTEVDVIDRNRLQVAGTLPHYMSTNQTVEDLSMIIHDRQTGYQVMPSAITVTRSETSLSNEHINWITELPVEGTEWTFAFPFRSILYETIRNTFFHVAIWMAMFVLLIVSLTYSILYLRSKDLLHDAVAASFAHVAVVLGITGMITGSIWARYTWGTYWTNDPKLNLSAVAMLIYLAYSILRSSITSDDQRARLSAVYNVFAFMAMIPLVFIIPRLTSSLHPGNGGNPALGGEDMDHTLRMVFYPAIIGYTILGVWISSIVFRIRRLQLHYITSDLQNS